MKAITTILASRVTWERTVRPILGEVAEPPVLVVPDWDAIEVGSRLLTVKCDASTDDTGLMHEQKQLDEPVHPLISSVVRPWMHNTNTPLDREAGAFVSAIKRLHGYL